ncbi:M56 family metallopeptidase [Chitinophaga barathri]|uniref:Peptidase M56 domain-containing protein n=1 Tax=Chitinophaga barathri TaxID=1647451 RepID=A0A3N4MPP8_9BACT|nr:M56 family metallopeptidase [Chitinophaga barathri]RPD41639.1 hypothetical protein EG028_10055 [Chitinophaga barathri]
MTSLLPFTQDLIRAFGWTLLHSFWQAFFVFACLRIVLWLWPQASASIKYHLSYLSLAGITGWFMATLYTQLSVLREAQELQAVTLNLDPAFIARAVQQAPARQSGLQTMFPGMESYFPILVAVYIIGVSVMTIKLCLDLSQLRQVRQQGVTPMGKAWDQHLRGLGMRLGITKKVQLFISDHLQVPVMIGFLKPVILLPAAMVNNLSPEQLEAILLHELAHIKRNDYLLNIFQSIVETILFFNPFVWWISRNIRQEREHCCDDLVIAGTVQPMHYAKALVALEEYRITANPMAMAAAHDKHFLLHRIKRIMEMKTKNLNYSQRFLALLIILTGLVSIAWLNPGRKNDKKEKELPAKELSVFSDTIPAPAKAPVTPGVVPAPPLPPPPPIAEDLESPPAPPVPPAAPTPHPFPAAAPLPPAPPSPSAMPRPAAPPLPPTPPTPPEWVAYNGNWNGNGNRSYYSGSYNGSYSYSFDTLAPGQKIIIIDDKGVKKEYSSIDEMPAADRKRMEESFYKMQQAQSNMRFQYKVNQDEMAKAMKKAQDAIAKIDWSKMNAQIQANMKNVDWEKVNKQMAEGMKNIDWKKMNADIAKQMKDIQWDKISEQMKNQMKSQDWDKMSKEIKESMDKIDWKKIESDVKKAMENHKWDSSFQYNFDYDGSNNEDAHRRTEEARARTRDAHERAIARTRDQQYVNAERVRAQQAENVARTRAIHDENVARTREIHAQNMARTRAINEEARERQALQAERQRERAQHDRERAEATNKNYRLLLEGLESDKLIDRNSSYNVEKKDGALFINGQKQPDDILKKYGQYLKNDNVSIRGSKNELSIQTTDNK